MAARKRARKATRKKTTRAKAGRKKATRKKARKKTTRKKAARKATRKKAPRKATRKKAARKAARKATRKKAARKATRKKAPRKAARKAPARRKSASPSPLVALAKKIVQAGESDGAVALEDLYTADCVSYESGSPEPSRGLDGLREKMENWSQMQEGASFKPVSVNFGKDTIAIEWEGTVKLRGGPTVSLEEVAIHRIKGGKIAWERYYYDPSPFMQAAAPAPPEPAAAPRPEPVATASSTPEPPRYEPSPMTSDDDDDRGPSGFDL